MAEYSVEINKLKRKSENENGFMLPYYKIEDNVTIENPIQKEVKNVVDVKQK